MLHVGLDQSFSSSGCVILDKHGEAIFSELVYTDKADGSDTTRSIMIAEGIVSMIESVENASEDELAPVAIENLAFGMKGMVLQRLAGLRGVIMGDLERAGYTTLDVAPSTVKKRATGSGKADKQQLFEALPEKLQKRFGNLPKSHGRYDLVDAYWISVIGKETWEANSEL